MRFVVTGSGRSGTRYMADLLSSAGVPCGHERAYGLAPSWDDRVADSSWMAIPALPIPEPVALMVRHPLAVVKSWIEIGLMSWQLEPGPDYNPCHNAVKPWAPWVYEYPAEQDRALAWWVALNETALPHAEVLLRLETFSRVQFERLLRWSGHAGDVAAFDRVPPTNRHTKLRERTGVSWEPSWSLHDGDLAARARRLAALLGYEVDDE